MAEPPPSADLIEFHGIVHPAEHGWEIVGPVPIWSSDQCWIFTLEKSKFHVLALGGYREDFATFRNKVMSFVHGVLDALGFCLGCALVPELQWVSWPPDGKTTFTPGWPAAAGRDDNQPRRASAAQLAPIIELAVQERLVRCALSDLSLAIDRPDDTSFYAYRAVESIRQFFVGPSSSKKGEQTKSWQRLRKKLDVSVDDLARLSDEAKPRRHGDILPISEEERLANLRLARTVVEKFIEHYRQGRYEPPVSNTDEPDDAVT